MSAPKLVNNVARASNPDIHKVTAGEAAVLDADCTDDGGTVGSNLPKQGILVSVESVVLKDNAFNQSEDRWTLDIAAFKGRISDNSLVASEERDTDDFLLSCLHETIIH